MGSATPAVGRLDTAAVGRQWIACDSRIGLVAAVQKQAGWRRRSSRGLPDSRRNLDSVYRQDRLDDILPTHSMEVGVGSEIFKLVVGLILMGLLVLGWLGLNESALLPEAINQLFGGPMALVIELGLA